MPEEPKPSTPAPATGIDGLRLDELLARGMQSVRMTGGGGLNSWEPPTVTEVAKLFPTFELMDLIGRGGMGAVYKARQLALDRFVAIKLLPLEVSVDRDFADRFVREARTMARLNHPSIVSVYDFGKTSEGHLYFVMEFVEGTTLHQMIKTVGLKPASALEIIVSVCEALQFAHTEGVVHRDIKPANILVDVRGRVKVTDFGLARLNDPTGEQRGYTMTGAVLGTPDYMAPEQKQGSHVDHRADIYSLGVMLYEMLCGQVPQGIFAPPSQRVSVDGRVDQVVIRAMQQEPDRRYQATAEMRTDVDAIRKSPQRSDVAAGFPEEGRTIISSPQSRGTASTNTMPALPPGPVVPVYQPPAAASAVAMGGGVASVSPSQAGGTQAPVSSSASTAPVGIGIAVAGLAIAAGLFLMMNKKGGEGTNTTGNTPAPIVAPTPDVKPATPEPAPTLAAAATPVPVPAPPPVVAATTVPEPVPVMPDTPQAPPIPPAIESVPTAIAPVTPVATPIPMEVPVWREAEREGMDALRRRQPDEAIEALYVALDLASEGSSPAPPYEIARLCQKVGSLQGQYGSGAEARGTLNRGRAILMNLKPKDKASIDDNARLLAEIEESLKRLPKD